MNIQRFLALLVLCHVSKCEPTDSCCQLSHLEQCNVFQHAGRSICTQETLAGLGHGGCPRKMSQTNAGRPSHIKLGEYDVQPTTCSSTGSDEGCGDRNGLLTLTLNMSFTLDGPHVQGLLFHVYPSEDRTKPTSCHYVILNETLSDGDVVQNQGKKIFHFDGFDEDFHPGSHYVVRARTLPDPEDRTLHLVDSTTVQIPDCRSLPERDSIYFCTLPSPAKWNSSVFVMEGESSDDSLRVVFTTNVTADPVIDYYNVTLERVQGGASKAQIIINNNTFWHWNETLRSNVLEHTFTNLTWGTYKVTVHPRLYRKMCTDSHWSMNNDCPEFGASYEIKQKITPVTPPLPSTQWPWYWLVLCGGLVILSVITLVLIFFFCCYVFGCRVWKVAYSRPVADDDDFTTARSEFRFFARPLDTGRGVVISNGCDSDQETQSISYRGGGMSLSGYQEQSGNYQDNEELSTNSLLSKAEQEETRVLRQDSGISVSWPEVEVHGGLTGTTPPIMEEVHEGSML